MQVTFALVFLSCFFNVLSASSSNPSGQNSTPRKRGFYDIDAQRRALITWDPHVAASRHSRHITILKSLVVKLEGPEKITSEELTLTTTITNTASKTLILVNEPSGVLYSRRPTDRFYVTHSTGTIPQFKGVRVKFSLTKAIKLGDVTVLDPGQSMSVTHRLSDAYDLTATGFGHYNVKPRNIFFVVNPVTKRVAMVQAGTTQGTSVEWPSRLVARDDIDNSANHYGAQRVQNIKITKFLGTVSTANKEALEEANQMVVDHTTDALSYLNKTQWDTAPVRYDTWFGSSKDTQLREKVIKMLEGILNFGEEPTYHIQRLCFTSKAAKGHFTSVKICPSFFKLEAPKRAFALISALSHYAPFQGLHNHATGEKECKALASANPDKAVENADSFGFFIMNNPPLP